MFDRLTAGLSAALKSLSGRGRLSDDNISDTVREVRLAGGEAIDAWGYLLRAVPPVARRIEDGRWMPR